MEKLPPDHREDRASAAEAGVAPPSLPSLKEILKRAADSGRITWTPEFQARCKLRGAGPGFNSVDAVNVIRSGKVVRGPRWDTKRKVWRFEVADLVEGHNFVVDLGLDSTEDYVRSPRVTIVTGFFRRGRKVEVKDWSNTK